MQTALEIFLLYADPQSRKNRASIVSGFVVRIRSQTTGTDRRTDGQMEVWVNVMISSWNKAEPTNSSKKIRI